MRVPHVLPALIFGLVCLWTNQGQAQTTTFNNGTGNGQWENAGNWTNGVPNSSTGAVIPNGQTVTINGGTTVASLNNMGTIQGPNGTTSSGGGVDIATSSGGITNSGTITGGMGASTATLGGNGGSVQLTATRGQAITNSGQIRGGRGGNDLPGGPDNVPGSGGSVMLRTSVDPATMGGGVTNTPSGTIQGGNGGTTPAGGTPSVDRGTGGDVRFEGAGGARSGSVTGDRSGIQGGKSSFPDRDGKVTQDGNKISLSGPGTLVEGGALAFTLNDLNELLSLTHLDAGAILATNFGIDIVTQSGGTVDLTGNSAGIDVLIAQTQIHIFADTILLDPGVLIADITSPDAIVGPSTTIPEPATWLLVPTAVGLAWLAGKKRKASKKNRKAA